MKFSNLVFETSKETPSDAVVVSHILLTRAGFIKRVANGIYTLGMPAQRMALKIEQIIREEMNKLDGQEVKFPVVMPKEIWEMSGRYNSIGSEMARFKDRAQHDMVLGMTHEEAAVHFAMNTVKSYQKLPFMIYQIQTKFRDEPRSRGGLIRVREFTMKDAYSFHMTLSDLEKYYERQFEAYNTIFRRIGMKNFISVQSDSGMMGGKVAHEFMALTPDGEDELVVCSHCDYRANIEVAECQAERIDGDSALACESVFTSTYKTIEEVSDYLKVRNSDIIKAVAYADKATGEPVLVFLRGDLEVNETKLQKILQREIVPLSSESSPLLCFGNIGPSTDLPVKTVIYDKSIEGRCDMVVGANKEGYHKIHFNVGRDIVVDGFYDVANVKAGQKCVKCGHELTVQRGIEIGNIFQLGTKYTQSMGMTVVNENGELVNPIMGCYGIGVERAIASIIQNNHDEKGMILPVSVAPWTIHICPIRIDDEGVRSTAFDIYDNLTGRGLDVIIDDRNVSAGIKFADADLFGMPIRIVVSPKLIDKGEFEIKNRATGEVFNVAKDDLYTKIDAMIDELKSNL